MDSVSTTPGKSSVIYRYALSNKQGSCGYNKGNSIIEFSFPTSTNKDKLQDEWNNYWLTNNLPLAYGDELSPITKFFWNDRLTSTVFYNEEMWNWLNRKKIFNDAVDYWKRMTRKVLVKGGGGGNEQWYKFVILKHYNRMNKLDMITIDLEKKINEFIQDKNKEETWLRNNQETDMQNANIKGLSLNTIVNSHIAQWKEFNNNKSRCFNDITQMYHKKYQNQIKEDYQEFIEEQKKLKNVEYNPINNKIIIINHQGKIPESRWNPHQTHSTITTLFHCNYYLGMNHKLNIHFCNVVDNFNCPLKDKIRTCLFDINTTTNKTQSTLNTLNKIYQHSDIFGTTPIPFLSYFSYDSIENKISHFNDFNLSSNVFKELLFEDNYSTVFDKVEKGIKNGNNLSNYDIITTKHSSVPSFDLMLNIFIRNWNYVGEEDIRQSMNVLINFVNFYKWKCWVIPLDTIWIQFYKNTKYSEFRDLMKNIKNLLIIMKHGFTSLINAGR